MQLETEILSKIKDAVLNIYSVDVDLDSLTLQPTKSDFEGNLTFVVFQILKQVKGNPAEIADKIGKYLTTNSSLIKEYNIVKGFLNLTIKDDYWIQFIKSLTHKYWRFPKNEHTIVLEYCGPNTNKPLHLGHVRNMLIGWSLAEILQQAGNNVHKVNIYNDRGIAICKSMVAWKMFSNGETPDSTNTKGDHFVGDYYVRFNNIESEQAKPFIDQGIEKRFAVKETEINKQAQELLVKWENGDQATIDLWQTMNSWVYDGFNQTYRLLGVDFEKDYLESKTYQFGKELVKQGVTSKKFYQKEDQSVWADLEDVGLDQKLLLRSDGTSVYITQDIATAELRYEDYKMDRSIYVVGNEQDYHFKVLKEVLKKLEKPFADGIQHLSYGMVELPEGKMKTREGTVVDADDLIAEMIETAKQTTGERGKIDGYNDEQKNELYRQIGLGALKFFMLRVDPKKRMLFNPEESIDVQGFTGPFIQYTHARIKSLLRKNVLNNVNHSPNELLPEEINLIQHIHSYRNMLAKAAKDLDHSIVAHFAFDLAKLFNQFWERVPVSKEENNAKRNFRLVLASKVAEALSVSLGLLGIESPERM